MGTSGADGSNSRRPLREVLRGVRLVWKVNGLFLLILTVALAISGYLSNLDLKRSEIALATELSMESSDRIVRRIRELMMNDDPHDLAGAVNRMAAENPAYRDVRLLSHDGRVLASQLPEGPPVVDSLAWPCTVCHGQEGRGTDSVSCSFCQIIESADAERALSVVTPVFGEEGCHRAGCHEAATDSTILAVLQADYSLSRLDRLLGRRNRNTALAILISLVVGSLATWWTMERLLGKRIRTLREGARRLADHDFTFRFSDSTGDGLAQLVGVFDNMTSELSSTLTELMSAKEHLQAIVEDSADIIITVDPTGIITTFNPGAERILGYRREEIIGRRIEMLFADPRERDTAIARLEHTDHVVNYLTRFVTKDGDIRRVLLTLSRLRSPTGEPIGTMGVSKDVTRELELQRRLNRSQRMAALGQAITGIQHSIKNMLNVMKGGSYMVKLGLANDDRAMMMEGWEMVQQGIDDMTEMSRSMLDFARTKKLKVKPTDLGALAQRIHQLNRSKFQEEGVDLELDVAPGLPLVECDGDMIRSVIMDLTGNALDACSWKQYPETERPRVSVVIHPSSVNGDVEIMVRDNGEGMTEEVRQRIFTPFFSTKEKKGTGMGLAVVARIVSMHEGKTTVESEPGEGATFRISLPIKGPSLREEDMDA